MEGREREDSERLYLYFHFNFSLPNQKKFVDLLFFIRLSTSEVSSDAHDVSFSPVSSAESRPEERQGEWGNPGEGGGVCSRQSEQPAPPALSRRR